MPQLFESHKLTKACPQCGRKFTKTVRWLESHDEFTCTKCGAVFKTKEFRAALAKARKGADELIAKFKKKF